MMSPRFLLPEIRQFYMSEKIHIGELICNKLNENQRSIAWLAQKVHHDRSSLRKLLKKDSIDTKLLLTISTTLQFDFFSCYSEIFYNYNTIANEEFSATK